MPLLRETTGFPSGRSARRSSPRLVAVTSVNVGIAPSPLTIRIAVPRMHGRTELTIDQSVSNIGRMVNTTILNASATVVRVYVALTAATVLTLVLFSFVAPDLATGHAWGHAIIVVVLAVLLPLRLHAAREGKPSGLRAVGLISGALVAVNMVEGVLPGFFPTWMRVEMFCVAALMAGNVLLVVRAALAVNRPA